MKLQADVDEEDSPIMVSHDERRRRRTAAASVKRQQPYASNNLLRTAKRTRPAVDLTLSLRMAVALCVSVVLMLTLKSELTSLLLYPSAINLTIVSSRGDSS